MKKWLLISSFVLSLANSNAYASRLDWENYECQAAVGNDQPLFLSKEVRDNDDGYVLNFEQDSTDYRFSFSILPYGDEAKAFVFGLINKKSGEKLKIDTSAELSLGNEYNLLLKSAEDPGQDKILAYLHCS